MKTFLFVSITLLTLAISTQASAKLKVVTTLPDFAAVAKAVGQQHVDVESLVRRTQDPHYVDAKPSFIIKLNKANLLIMNGFGLESGWLPPLFVKARNANIQKGTHGYLNASTVIKAKNVTSSQDRSQGDIHVGGNPHFVHDPGQMKLIVVAIAKKLSALDPKHKKQYEFNALQYNKKLDVLRVKQIKRFAALNQTQRQVVNYHDSLVYLNDWLGLKRIATIEPKPGIAPSPKHTAHVFKQMKSTKTRLVVQEVFYPTKTSSTIAKLAKANFLRISGGSKTLTGQGYIEHIEAICNGMYKAIGAQ